MTTFTIYADATDGYLSSSDASYSNARAGSGTLAADAAGNSLIVGQQLTGGLYYAWEAFLSFDTSLIGAGAVVSSATLRTTASSLNFGTACTINTRSRDWGAGLTTGDFVAGASLSGDTLVASVTSSSLNSTGIGFGSNHTSEVAMLSAINTTGSTRFILSSSRHQGNNTPTGDEYFAFYSSDQSGTTKDPRLTVIAALPISGTASITEANDTPTATGTVAIAGTASVTETDDIVGAVIFTESPGQIQVKHAGAWQVPTTWVKHGGTWKQPIAGYVKDAGSWKRVL